MAKSKEKVPTPATSAKPAKFSQKERMELEEMPQKLEQLEAEQAALTEKLISPQTYQKQPEILPQLQADLDKIEAQIKKVYARWEQLEAAQT